MQDVTITFTSGPLRGRNYEFEVGRVIIGRQPGATGLELKGAGVEVSRIHAELIERGGDVVLRNRSPNGTNVDGKLIIDDVRLSSGAEIDIGGQFRFEVEWQSFGAETVVLVGDEKDVPAKQGPLSSPVVRAVVGIYLVGMVVAAWWLSSFGGSNAVADDWPNLVIAYQSYQTDAVSSEEWSTREAKAQLLVQELRTARTRGYNRGSETICREIMQLDRDPRSPVFKYGARCLGSQ